MGKTIGYALGHFPLTALGSSNAIPNMNRSMGSIGTKTDDKGFTGFGDFGDGLKGELDSMAYTAMRAETQVTSLRNQVMTAVRENRTDDASKLTSMYQQAKIAQKQTDLLIKAAMPQTKANLEYYNKDREHIEKGEAKKFVVIGDNGLPVIDPNSGKTFSQEDYIESQNANSRFSLQNGVSVYRGIEHYDYTGYKEALKDVTKDIGNTDIFENMSDEDRERLNLEGMDYVYTKYNNNSDQLNDAIVNYTDQILSDQNYRSIAIQKFLTNGTVYQHDVKGKRIKENGKYLTSGSAKSAYEKAVGIINDPKNMHKDGNDDIVKNEEYIKAEKIMEDWDQSLKTYIMNTALRTATQKHTVLANIYSGQLKNKENEFDGINKLAIVTDKQQLNNSQIMKNSMMSIYHEDGDKSGLYNVNIKRSNADPAIAEHLNKYFDNTYVERDGVKVQEKWGKVNNTDMLIPGAGVYSFYGANTRIQASGAIIYAPTNSFDDMTGKMTNKIKPVEAFNPATGVFEEQPGSIDNGYFAEYTVRIKKDDLKNGQEVVPYAKRHETRDKMTDNTENIFNDDWYRKGNNQVVDEDDDYVTVKAYMPITDLDFMDKDGSKVNAQYLKNHEQQIQEKRNIAIKMRNNSSESGIKAISDLNMDFFNRELTDWNNRSVDDIATIISSDNEANILGHGYKISNLDETADGINIGGQVLRNSDEIFQAIISSIGENKISFSDANWMRAKKGTEYVKDQMKRFIDKLYTQGSGNGGIGSDEYDFYKMIQDEPYFESLVNEFIDKKMNEFIDKKMDDRKKDPSGNKYRTTFPSYTK